MIQPQVLLRLPCYDFTLIICPTLGGWLLKGYPTDFGCYKLSWCDGRCVQGPGTYSPRHADPRLLAITSDSDFVQASCSLQSELRTVLRDLLALASSRLVVPSIVARVSPGHKGHDDLTSSPPSSGLSPAVSLECPT